MERIEKCYSVYYFSKQLSEVLFFTIAVAVTIWFTQLMWRRRKLYYHALNVRGAFAFPLLGSLYRFINTKSTGDILNVIIDIQREDPDLATFWFGPKLIYLVTRPDAIEKILTNPQCLSKDSLYKFVSEVIGDGLITATAEKWKRKRKLINPSFNQRVLNSFVEIFDSNANILNDVLQKHVGDTNIDLFNILTNCTLDIICETAMGLKINAQEFEECEFTRKIDRLMEITAIRIFHIQYHSDILWNLLPLSKEYAELMRDFDSFCGDVIKRKLAAHHRKMNDENDDLNAGDEDLGSNKFKAFLDLIIEDGSLEEGELKDEVKTFIVAGADTTASTLTGTLLCLGMMPDVQEKVYEEIISVIGRDRKVEPSDLTKLKYMEMVIKETLRIFPVVPYFLRQINEDLNLGDVILPKGSTAFFGPIHIHRNPKYWDDPLKFDPDRFLPEVVAKRQPFTYIPFSFGPRNCIGGRYAMMNIKTILCTVLRKYKFTSGYKSMAEVDIGTNITLRFTHGTKLTIHAR